MPRSQPESKRKPEAMRLRKLREALQFSQRDLASEFRVAHTAVSSWESGARTIPGPVLKLMEIYEDQAGMVPMRSERSSSSELPGTGVSRNVRLSLGIAGLAARFAGRFLMKWAGADADPMKDSAKLVQTLGNLKGLLMKAGQMVGYVHAGGISALREPFEILQSNASPLRPDLIERVIEEELGASPRYLFASWNPVPLGVGSIGQVHEARLRNGTEVALKVQYPGIRKSLHSDLKYTRFIDLFGTLVFRKQDRESFVDELANQADLECDYTRERLSQERFRKIFENDPEVRIPKTLPEFCSPRVLAQEKLSGRSFRSFCAVESQARKDHAGRILFRFAFESLFRHHILNCDPHPGNFQFNGDTVIFYDFGSVKELTPGFVESFRDLIRALQRGDRNRVAALAIEMGYVPETEGFDFDHHFEMLSFLYSPFIKDEEFTFTPAFVENVWSRIILNNKNRARSSVPRDWIFVNRLQWGLYSVLAELRARTNWKRLLDSLP
ncbi:MAG: helix-turn-helix domain-containing protein [Bdellovibrionales bacterium]|nr:helix-turn-helix domain-containing protein [Bdellovibrionales bacterium]